MDKSPVVEFVNFSLKDGTEPDCRVAIVTFVMCPQGKIITGVTPAISTYQIALPRLTYREANLDKEDLVSGLEDYLIALFKPTKVMPLSEKVLSIEKIIVYFSTPENPRVG